MLDTILGWLSGTSIDDPECSPLYWLHGVAGSGKSTVAKTVAKISSGRGHSLLCFFCRRDAPELSNPRRFFSTLSFLLAQRHAGYRRALYDLLSDPDNAGIGDDTISEQYQRLFKELLHHISEPLQCLIFIIDALDECGSPQEQAETAEFLVSLSRLVPWLKVLVTSRSEPRIGDVFARGKRKCTVSSIDDEVDKHADIRLYICARLAALSIQAETSIVDTLVAHASGSFIWCTTLFKYLEDRVDAEGVLMNLLADLKDGTSSTAGLVYDGLYTLYDQVLTLAIRNRADLPFARDILSLIFVSSATRPLSCDAIAGPLKRKVAPVRTVVRALHAVLYEEQEHEGPGGGAVRACHNSFRDYTSKNIDEWSVTGWRELGAVHLAVAERSLEVMVDELKFNICQLEGPPVLNTDIPDLDSLISTHISSVLQYGALFWLHHLSSSGMSIAALGEDLRRRVVQVISEVKVLFYLEVLSLLDAIEHGARLFFQCSTHFKVNYLFIKEN